MKKLLLTGLLPVLFIANSGITLLGMHPDEPTEESEPLIIQGGVGIEGSSLYTTGAWPSINQPKSLQQEALNKLVKQIIEGKITLEQAKQKLSPELFEQLKNDVEAKKQ